MTYTRRLNTARGASSWHIHHNGYPRLCHRVRQSCPHTQDTRARISSRLALIERVDSCSKQWPSFYKSQELLTNRSRFICANKHAVKIVAVPAAKLKLLAAKKKHFLGEFRHFIPAWYAKLKILTTFAGGMLNTNFVWKNGCFHT